MKTIDLMEGGKEQAQVVPKQTNSEINRCFNGVKDSVDIDGDGEEGNADGSSGDVPVQTNSEMNRCCYCVKDSVDIDRDSKEGTQTAAAMKMITRMMKKKKKGKVGKWNLQVEKSPRGHQTR